MTARRIPANARHIFIEFCARAGTLTRSQAAEEFDARLSCNGWMRLRDSYVMMSRIGASFTMTRPARVSVYLTFENACNHATFGSALFDTSGE